MIRKSGASDESIPSAVNAVIIVAQLGFFFAACCLVRSVHHAWQMVLLSLAFGVLMNSVYSIVHEAEHAILFRNRRLNDLTGAVMALLFPAPFHLIRQGHLGHHLRNRSDDEAFDLYFDGDSVIWRWIAWIGILTGFYYLVVVLSNPVAAVAPFLLDRRRSKLGKSVKLDRPGMAVLESFNPRYLGLIWIEAWGAILLHGSILDFVHVQPGRYLILYATFGFMWSAMQYVHHFGTERHVTRGTRNLFITAPIDVILLNHNWHRVHHEHPTTPWIHLPNLARQSGQTDRGFLPAFYLRMWAGPRRTSEHVENRYAGRIIQ